ncbi:hypothetical protein QL285_037100 [Trifolium repens]|nr:hypothetical protein QL285_037100 [Trifolium repens]
MGGAAIGLAIRTALATVSPGVWSAVRGGVFPDLCFSVSYGASSTLNLRCYHAYGGVSCLYCCLRGVLGFCLPRRFGGGSGYGAVWICHNGGVFRRGDLVAELRFGVAVGVGAAEEVTQCFPGS